MHTGEHELIKSDNKDGCEDTPLNRECEKCIPVEIEK
jgi:hypothetical protein